MLAAGVGTVILLERWVPKGAVSVNIKTTNTKPVYSTGHIYCIEFTKRKLVKVSYYSDQWITLFDEFGKARSC